MAKSRVVQWLFLTHKDASANTKADSHTEACSLVTTLPCGYHVFERTLKVKGVNQPLKQKKGGEQSKTVFGHKNTNITAFLL